MGAAPRPAHRPARPRPGSVGSVEQVTSRGAAAGPSALGAPGGPPLAGLARHRDHLTARGPAQGADTGTTATAPRACSTTMGATEP